MAQPGAPERGFSPDEFAARAERAQTLMAERGLDALLATTEPEVRYLTGFLTPFWQSPTRPWFVVLARRGRPIAVIPSIGIEAMARAGIAEIRDWPAPRPDDDGVSLLAATLREVAGAGGAIGVAMDGETHLRMPLADFARLKADLPGATWVDSTAIWRRLRRVKSPAEIAKIGHVCALASDAFARAPDLFVAGMSEIEVFRAFKIACLAAGVDDVAYLVGGAGPGGYGDIISPPAQRALRAGDVLILDTGCVFDGYFCDFDRNWAFGHVDDAARRAYDTVFAATGAGLAAARPGATCADLFQAMNAVLEAGGATGNDVGRLGHGLGMQLTEWPSHTAFDATVLEPGMVITLEPGMTFAPGKCMVHEENIVIRADGPELLTRRAPAELPVL